MIANQTEFFLDVFQQHRQATNGTGDRKAPPEGSQQQGQQES